MSALSTINHISIEMATYAPALVLAAQSIGGTGAEKQSAFVKSLTGIEVASGALETNPNPLVASAAILANMLVSLFKALKHPAFVAPAAVAP